MSKTNIDFWEKLTQNPSDLYKRLFEQEKKYLENNVKSDSRVLDIGCGDGRNILSIVEKVQSVVGIDIDPKAIEDAIRRLHQYKNVQIILGSAFDLPCDEYQYDVVILSMTFVNFSNHKNKSLTEMKRVLKPGGKIVMSVYSEHAMNERLNMYKKIGVPVQEVLVKEVIFDKSVGANTSEQFSIQDIESMAKSVGLKMTHYEEVLGLAYIITLENI